MLYSHQSSGIHRSNITGGDGRGGESEIHRIIHSLDLQGIGILMVELPEQIAAVVLAYGRVDQMVHRLLMEPRVR